MDEMEHGVTDAELQGEPVEPFEVEQVEQVERVEQVVEQGEEKPQNFERHLKAALKEERDRRKASDAKIAQMEMRFNQILERMQQPQQEQKREAPEAPDRETDPVGYLEWQNNQLMEEVRSLKQGVQQDRSVNEQQQAFMAYTHGISSDEVAYQKENPNYGASVQFLFDRRVSELKAMGYEDNEIKGALAQDALFLTQQAIQRGRRPSEFAYEYATALGFTPQAQQAQQTPKPKAKGTSLSNVSGVPEGGMPSLSQISSMSDEDFEAFWNKSVVKS